MSTVTASTARTELPALLDRVESGEEITITRHGRPVAVVVRPDVLRTRRVAAAWSGAEQVRKALVDARKTPLADAGGLAPGRADELVAQLRADRDAG